MTQPTPPPGWYPDPAGAGLRWFNGTDWTDVRPPAQQFAPQFAPPQPPAETGRFTIHYGFALLAVLSLGATLFFGLSLWASNPSGPPTLAILWMLWGGMWTLIWTAFAINHTLKARRR